MRDARGPAASEFVAPVANVVACHAWNLVRHGEKPDRGLGVVAAPFPAIDLIGVLTLDCLELRQQAVIDWSNDTMIDLGEAIPPPVAGVSRETLKRLL